MDVRIGITNSAREIEVDMADDVDRDSVMSGIETALAGPDSVLWLTDRKGRRVGVPCRRVAYVEVGGDEGRRVGFGAP